MNFFGKTSLVGLLLCTAISLYLCEYALEPKSSYSPEREDRGPKKFLFKRAVVPSISRKKYSGDANHIYGDAIVKASVVQADGNHIYGDLLLQQQYEKNLPLFLSRSSNTLASGNIGSTAEGKAIVDNEKRLEELEKKLIETVAEMKKIEKDLAVTNTNIQQGLSAIAVTWSEIVNKKENSITRPTQQRMLDARSIDVYSTDFAPIVAFFAQRSSTYDKKGSFISYTKLATNEPKKNGNIGLDSGIFTVPFSGVYYIYFSALKTSTRDAWTSRLTVQLQLRNSNGMNMLAEGHVNSNDNDGWYPINVQATVFLNQSDQVGVVLVEGSIHEHGSCDHLVTAFGGFLIDPYTYV